MVQPRPAIVSIMADGSVMVTTAGMEMGQGMFTKVKQVSLVATVTTGLTPVRRCMQESHNAQLSCMVNFNGKLRWRVKALGSRARPHCLKSSTGGAGREEEGSWARLKLMPVAQLAPAAGSL